MSGSGGGLCGGCLPRLCTTKDGGRVTALSFWSDAETLVEVPDCGVVTYDCAEGECVPVEGEGGQYATLGECQAACGGITVACCPSPIPATLTLAFGGAGVGNCCFNGAGPVSLVWSAANQWWEGTYSGGDCSGTPSTFRFYCAGGVNFALDWICNGAAPITIGPGGGDTCNPVNYQFHPSVGVNDCCNPIVSLTFTVTE